MRAGGIVVEVGVRMHSMWTFEPCGAVGGSFKPLTQSYGGQAYQFGVSS